VSNCKGLRTVRPLQHACSPAALRRPLGDRLSERVIEGLWHTTAMGERYDDLLDPCMRYFGAVVMHDQELSDEGVERRGGMVWLGDNSIELGEPFGAESLIRPFLERFGGGMHSVALRVADADATRRRLEGRGIAVVAEVGDRVFFTRPADTGHLLLEWSSAHSDDDPRFGHSLPTPARRPPRAVAPARRYAFVTAAVSDPIGTADLLASLLETEVVRRVPEAAPGEISAIVSLVDCLLILFALPTRAADWPWGPHPTRARFHSHGLLVDDLGQALAALAALGIEGSRRLEHCVFLDSARVSIPTFLCERLFVEDPRRW
jgi:hypothetical protein